mgnify:CR=1 FL=1
MKILKKEKKLVTHEQIDHWPKFSASEGTNSEFMSTSETLKEECQCVRNACVSVRASDCILQLHLEGGGPGDQELAYEGLGQLKRN